MDHLRDLLQSVAAGETPVDTAYETLKTLPQEELGDAVIDTHRKLRTGFPEVVFCQNKTEDQCARIMQRIVAANGMVLGTRASREQYDAVKAVLSDAVYHEAARCITVGGPAQRTGRVAVCTAGTTDIPVAEEAAVTAEICGAYVDRFYDIGVSGIHRLFDKVSAIRSANAVVAVAGMEGALASVIGGLVSQPVIAVPTSIGYGANFGGVSALLAMLNSCAAGTAVVNIDNGFGAGYLAAQINRTGVQNAADPEPEVVEEHGPRPPLRAETITLIETNVDDCSGEQLGYAVERLFAAGAADAWFTPIYMKKNRPAYALSVMCRPDAEEDIVNVLFRETTVIGLRRTVLDRIVMERTPDTVETPYGPVRVKRCTYGDIRKVYPEYESVRALAEQTGISFREVYESALEEDRS